MKAALNGVPSLSVLDGWWVEGHVEGVTGWAIGDGGDASDPRGRAASLYDEARADDRRRSTTAGPTTCARVMRSAIALNGSFFNAQRMVTQYMLTAYHAATQTLLEV